MALRGARSATLSAAIVLVIEVCDRTVTVVRDDVARHGLSPRRRSRSRTSAGSCSSMQTPGPLRCGNRWRRHQRRSDGFATDRGIAPRASPNLRAPGELEERHRQLLRVLPLSGRAPQLHRRLLAGRHLRHQRPSGPSSPLERGKGRRCGARCERAEPHGSGGLVIVAESRARGVPADMISLFFVVPRAPERTTLVIEWHCAHEQPTPAELG